MFFLGKYSLVLGTRLQGNKLCQEIALRIQNTKEHKILLNIIEYCKGWKMENFLVVLNFMRLIW
jgi:hypothetical protein